MTDRATPNLPSRDFGATSAFYASLGSVEDWREEGWMILKRGDVTLEFFPHPELDSALDHRSPSMRRVLIAATSLSLIIASSAGVAQQAGQLIAVDPVVDRFAGKPAPNDCGRA